MMPRDLFSKAGDDDNGDDDDWDTARSALMHAKVVMKKDVYEDVNVDQEIVEYVVVEDVEDEQVCA